ncbi:hypothetical protein THASP1DRAFT_29085 [Thamnocephalis sphaerospora]|uniref:Uncharacterized protein n=1 Tax=Thamnocephalis sphaerospora TaxID=78915 RepID=A0A4P9XSK3_9FUNG|nr:hypothetical protein THASP1DRAFT_29085 [Thamnocephalis sphaerospora]|eukprot:RKP09123.1 hypothetical protein THASP1DRAFT_29085 [Thamnocephalis sphaerospora]
MASFIQIAAQVEGTVNKASVRFLPQLAGNPGHFEVYEFVRSFRVAAVRGQPALLSLQRHIFVETCVDEGQPLDACELLEIFVADAHLPSSALLRNLIQHAASTKADTKIVAACQRLCARIKHMLRESSIETVVDAASLLEAWDFAFFWETVHSVIRRACSVDTSTADGESCRRKEAYARAQMLIDTLTTLVQCELIRHPENAARVILGERTSMVRRSMVEVSLDWLADAVVASSEAPFLLEACQSLLHTASSGLASASHCFATPKQIINQCHAIMRSLAGENAVRLICTIESNTFKGMLINHALHNSCEFRNVASEDHYLTCRPISLVKIARLFFACELLEHAQEWLQETHLIQLLAALAASYLASRSIAVADGALETEQCYHGLTEEELTVLRCEWDDRVDGWIARDTDSVAAPSVTAIRLMPRMFFARLERQDDMLACPTDSPIALHA